MRNKLLFSLAIVGVLAGLFAARYFGASHKPQPPAFKPASNPFGKGIYANGIIEADQESGSNVNLYPEVAGTVVRIMVSEGQEVKAGMPLFMIDSDVQRATVDQLKAQADAASAQIGLARANLQNLDDQYDKQKASFDLDPKSVSRDALDTAKNAALAGKASLDVSEKQYLASLKAYRTAKVLLSKYVVKAPSSGRVLSINASLGGYLSPQGVYDTYTGGLDPAIVMGRLHPRVEVRCYVDEILIQRLPMPARMEARMFVRGTDINLPLEYVRSQPYVSPKIELSNQRTERVDVRVLPLIFRFEKPDHVALYPGQLVDVYIGQRP